MNPTVINSAPPSGAIHKLQFIAVLAIQLVKIVALPKLKVVYLAANAGAGRWFDLLFLIVARVRGCRLLIHHHSFRYIDVFSRAEMVRAWIGGPRATHIHLCCAMASRYREHYGAEVSVLSNSALVVVPQSTIPRNRAVQQLGLLSNLIPEKGIDNFISLVRALKVRGVEVHGLIAGPIQHESVAHVIEAARAEGLRITQVGALYGAKKDQFFESIDVFIFPSRYINEAEPLVVHEAASRAIPVLASSRGCIADVISPGRAILGRDGYEIGAAVEVISMWVRNQTEYSAASLATLQQAVYAKKASSIQLEKLLSNIAECIGSM